MSMAKRALTSFSLRKREKNGRCRNYTRQVRQACLQVLHCLLVREVKGRRGSLLHNLKALLLSALIFAMIVQLPKFSATSVAESLTTP